MSKAVGLSRTIKKEWLDKTAELATQDDDEASIKEKLNEYLSFEIGSPTNLRKTREILLNVWVRSADTVPDVHSMALQAFKSDESNRLALSWSMLLLAYPVFVDVTGLIGKISSLQDTFTTGWLREKLHEQWGERATLFHACDKILHTLKYLGAIENVEQGVYRTVKYKVIDDQTICVLLSSLLALERKAYYEIPELPCISLFFPFEFSVSIEWLHRSPEFKLESFGGKTVLSATK